MVLLVFQVKDGNMLIRIVLALLLVSCSVYAEPPSTKEIQEYRLKKNTMTSDEVREREFEIREKYFDLCSSILKHDQLRKERKEVDQLVDDERIRILRTSTDFQQAYIDAKEKYQHLYQVIEDKRQIMVVELKVCYRQKIIKEF